MELNEFAAAVEGFAALQHPDKIVHFGWFLHTQRNKERFDQAAVRACYKDLSMQEANFSEQFTRLIDKRPKVFMKDAKGYFLEHSTRARLDAKYGKRPTAAYVDKLLAELPSRIPNLAERTYLDEAIICFRNGANRAAVIMTWNLAFDHICEYVLAGDLAAFNTQLPKSFPKAEISGITKKDDFQELKESQILQVCKSANIISGSLHKILKEKLDRRNIAAHPSGMVVTAPTAEEFIRDLIENAVLKLV